MEAFYLAYWKLLEVEGHGLLQKLEHFGSSGHGHWWCVWLTTATPRLTPWAHCSCQIPPDMTAIRPLTGATPIIAAAAPLTTAPGPFASATVVMCGSPHALCHIRPERNPMVWI